MFVVAETPVIAVGDSDRAADRVRRDRRDDDQKRCGQQRLVADERERLLDHDRDGDAQRADRREAWEVQAVERVPERDDADRREQQQRDSQPQEHLGQNVPDAHRRRSKNRAKVSEPITAIGASTTASSMNGGRANATVSVISSTTVSTLATLSAASADPRSPRRHTHTQGTNPTDEHERGGQPEVHPSFSGSISRRVGASSWTRSTSASVSMPMT